MVEADVARDAGLVDAVEVLLQAGRNGAVFVAELGGELEVAFGLGLEDGGNPVVNGFLGFVVVDVVFVLWFYCISWPSVSALTDP